MAENKAVVMAEAEYNASNGTTSVVLDMEQASSLQSDRMDAYAEVANKMLEEG